MGKTYLQMLETQQKLDLKPVNGVEDGESRAPGYA
jgi:hypothetical protein